MKYDRKYTKTRQQLIDRVVFVVKEAGMEQPHLLKAHAEQFVDFWSWMLLTDFIVDKMSIITAWMAYKNWQKNGYPIHHRFHVLNLSISINLVSTGIVGSGTSKMNDVVEAKKVLGKSFASALVDPLHDGIGGRELRVIEQTLAGDDPDLSIGILTPVALHLAAQHLVVSNSEWGSDVVSILESIDESMRLPFITHIFWVIIACKFHPDENTISHDQKVEYAKNLLQLRQVIPVDKKYAYHVLELFTEAQKLTEDACLSESLMESLSREVLWYTDSQNYWEVRRSCDRLFSKAWYDTILKMEEEDQES